MSDRLPHEKGFHIIPRIFPECIIQKRIMKNTFDFLYIDDFLKYNTIFYE